MCRDLILTFVLTAVFWALFDFIGAAYRAVEESHKFSVLCHAEGGVPYSTREDRLCLSRAAALKLPPY